MSAQTNKVDDTNDAEFQEFLADMTARVPEILAVPDYEAKMRTTYDIFSDAGRSYAASRRNEGDAEK